MYWNEKKLVTSYSFVKTYDFYSKNNIYVLEEGEYKISEEFFKNKYLDIDREIFINYSGEKWIKKILGVY